MAYKKYMTGNIDLLIMGETEANISSSDFYFDPSITQQDLQTLFNVDSNHIAEYIMYNAMAMPPRHGIGERILFIPDDNNPENFTDWCLVTKVNNQTQYDNYMCEVWYCTTTDGGLTYTKQQQITSATYFGDKPSDFLGQMTILMLNDPNTEQIGLALGFTYVNDSGTVLYGVPIHSAVNLTKWSDTYNIDYNFENIDPDFGPESEPDGYGQKVPPAHDHTSDTITIPSDPTVSTHDTGFMHVYHVSSGALATLGQYLFPSAANITDIESALRAIAGIFAYRDNVQYIVDLHAIPVLPTDGSSEYIKVGSLVTEITQPVCASDYVTFDCGSISLPENEGNYLDYILTSKLYLPFVGFIDISPEYWNGGSLNVTYKFNIIDGSFIAYVRSSSSKSNLRNSLIGQYGGSACLHMPVIANSYGALASGLVSGSMAIAAGAATGNVAGAMESAITAANFQGKTSSSNNYNSSSAYLGGRRPYLLLERPVPSFAGGYRHDKGLPLNVTMSLASVHGFTVIEDIDLSGITGCTDNELEELRRLLSEGVYF